MSMLSVQSGQFDGPIDLLLDLIRSRKLHISEVSLAEVTDAYIEQLRAMQEQGYAHLSFFIVIASTLLLIKSRALLPTLRIDEEEEETIHDLERRLKILNVYTERATPHIKNMLGRAPGMRRTFQSLTVAYAPDREGMKVKEMHKQALEVLGRIPEAEPLVRVEMESVLSLDVMIEKVLHSVKTRLRDSITFTEVLDASGLVLYEQVASRRMHRAVGLLAILELARMSDVILLQKEPFGEIELSRIE